MLLGMPHPSRISLQAVIETAREILEEAGPEGLAMREVARRLGVRAPSLYERAIRNGPEIDRAAFESQLQALARRLVATGDLTAEQEQSIREAPLKFSIEDRLPVEAADAVRFILTRGGKTDWTEHGSVIDLSARAENGILRTTIDGELQNKVNRLLRSQLDALADRNVTAGAALVIDHKSGQILAWSSQSQGRSYNNVVLPRQPGSALKPFLYALALENGWTAATPIADTPLARPVGHGLHRIRNYSNLHYGSVRLREALGNSLNVPAIRTVEFVGVSRLLEKLRQVGMSSLGSRSEFYGEGLALGNGEVTLLELVGAYASLARGGLYLPSSLLLDDAPGHARPRQVFSPQAASIVSDILSDPNARTLEFGPGNILRFPVETAVKTGTSTDYRDAWAVGFTSHYTVGVWMGNLEQTPMADVTGSIGPALVLRSIFSELNRATETRPLYRDPSLRRIRVCRLTGARAGANCQGTDELFMPATEPAARCAIHSGADHDGAGRIGGDSPEGKESDDGPIGTQPKARPWIIQPTDELHLAKDPRIPDKFEAFQFKLAGYTPGASVDWIVDGSSVATTEKPDYLWPVERGSHSVRARVRSGDMSVETTAVNFLVK